MPSPQVASDNLSPAQASFVYWLNGLAQVATNIVTPLIVYWRMRKMPQGPLVKYNQQINEVVRQFISGTIGLVSYFGGGELTRGLINGSLGARGKGEMDDSSKHVAMIVGGVIASFIGFAFVRPYISTNLICKFLKQERGVEAMFTSHDVVDILKSGQELGHTDAYSIRKAMAALEQKKTSLVSAEAGAISKHWLIGPLQKWVDHHLVPRGKPDLVKLARYSTMALTGYLSALTILLWGVNRLMGRKELHQSMLPKEHPAAMAPSALYPLVSNAASAMPVGWPSLRYGNQGQTVNRNPRMASPLMAQGVRGLSQIR